MTNIQENIFSTTIWGFVMNNQQYQLQDYIDYIIEMAKKEPTVKKSNFGGWQSRDNIHETEGIFRELTSSINSIANDILSQYGCESTEIKEMWANINSKYCYNGAHTHSGIISGVLYLQTPLKCGKLILVNPAIRSDGHFFRNSNYGIKPEKLACIMFPSWLEHYVEPNESDDLRISMSFNIGVK